MNAANDRLSPEKIRVVPMTPGHHAGVLELNNINVPEVNGLDLAELARLHAFSLVALSALDGTGEVVGFCLVYGPGEDYSSLNYLWFSQRYTRFAYLDRIAVAQPARRRGVGEALYGGVFAALERHPSITTLCCEVNLRPHNEPSLRFHHRLGFREVGQQDTDGGAKTVSLLTIDLASRLGARGPGPE